MIRWPLRGLAGALMTLATLAAAQTGGQPEAPALAAPNPVIISPRLVTSGQPTAAALAGLAAAGFGGVIHLAPLTTADAVRDEPAIVTRQGLAYVNIPIAFDAPGDADFDAFVTAMKGQGERKVLVHCQVNFRASSLVFLYRVIVAGEAPEAAYEAVARVWSPAGAWKRFIVAQLRRHRIDFEPY